MILVDNLQRRISVETFLGGEITVSIPSERRITVDVFGGGPRGAQGPEGPPGDADLDTVTINGGFF